MCLATGSCENWGMLYLLTAGPAIQAVCSGSKFSTHFGLVPLADRSWGHAFENSLPPGRVPLRKPGPAITLPGPGARICGRSPVLMHHDAIQMQSDAIRF